MSKQAVEEPTTLADITQDINWAITDLETLAVDFAYAKSGLTTVQFKAIQDSMKRATGQLKAARASVIQANRALARFANKEEDNGSH